MADQERTGVYVANGIISGFVLVCGIVFSAMMGLHFDSFFKGVSSFTGFAYLPVWAIGFAYIVPGFLGLLATCCRAKGGYVTQMVFCILTLLTMGIFAVFALLAVTAIGFVNSSCDDAFDDLCTETVGSVFGDVYIIMASMILGWILTLVITILGGVLACRRQVTPRLENGANEHNGRRRRQSDDAGWMGSKYGNATSKPRISRISSPKILALLSVQRHIRSYLYLQTASNS